MSEEDIILWQDVLDLVMAGRTSDLQCPFCKQGQVKVEKIHLKTRLSCEKCRHYIEGAFPADQE